jgi:hypothetical protein
MPQPTTTSLVNASNNGAPSLTCVSHVGDGSTTSASHVEEPQPASASHAARITLVATSHIDVTSPTFVHHVGDDSLASASHIERIPPAIVNDVGVIEKPRCLRRKPKFFCRTCKGNHLTRLCPATAGIPEAWGSPKSPSDFEAFVVSPHPISPLIDTEVMSMPSSLDLTSVVKDDVSPIPIIMHPIQPRVEEVVVPVQSLVNPTLLVGCDTSFNHVVIIHNTAPSEQERVLLSPSSLSASPGDIPFDWDGLVGYPMPPPMSFLVRDII